MRARRKRAWIGLSALYLLILLAVALFYLLPCDQPADEKVLLTLGVAVLPAAAFVAAVAPLWRESHSRLTLNSSAAFAVIAANLQLGLTFSLSLPLSLVLLWLGWLNAKRAGRLKRHRTNACSRRPLTRAA